MSDQRRQALMKEYSETLNNFRLLTQIRFKLLTHLPAATVLTFALSASSHNIGGAYVLVIAAFGLAITIALVTYNARNDQLYDELVRHAASIERSLDLADGAFANRPRHWLTIRLPGCKWPIDHRRSVGLIYAATVALWLFLLLIPVLELTHRVLRLSLPQLSVVDPELWVKVLAFVLATEVTALAASFVIDQNKERRKTMRELAKCAVELVMNELPKCAVDPVQSTELAKIRGDKFERLVKRCAELSQLEDRVVRARACSYTDKHQKTLPRYLPRNSQEQLASQFVALLTDLTPEYLLDCFTNRTGMKEEFEGDSQPRKHADCERSKYKTNGAGCGCHSSIPTECEFITKSTAKARRSF